MRSATAKHDRRFVAWPEALNDRGSARASQRSDPTSVRRWSALSTSSPAKKPSYLFNGRLWIAAISVTVLTLSLGTAIPPSPDFAPIESSLSLAEASPPRAASAELDALLQRARSIADSEENEADLLPQQASGHVEPALSLHPTSGFLTSPFLLARAHPLLKTTRPHRGIDISAPWGAPIFAPAAGSIVSAGPSGSYGNVVIIDHGSGVMTRYAHCSILLVRVGQSVRSGQPVALVGDSGLSTGPHLHYEILIDGRPIDPLLHRWN